MSKIKTKKEQAFLALCKQHLQVNATYNEQNYAMSEAAIEKALSDFTSEVKLNCRQLPDADNQRVYLESVLDELAELSDALAPSTSDILEFYVRNHQTPPSTPIDEQVETELVATYGEAYVVNAWLWALRRIREKAPALDAVHKWFSPLAWSAYQIEVGSTCFYRAWNEIGALFEKQGRYAGDSPRDYLNRKPPTKSVLPEMKAYVPWVFTSPKEYYRTEHQALEEWVRHLASLSWRNYPSSRPWIVPIEYERAFFLAPDREAFVTGVKRLLRTAQLLLSLDDNDDGNWLLRYPNTALSSIERDSLRANHLLRARTAAKHLGEWLRKRQLPAPDQLLDALKAITVVPDWDQDGLPTKSITIANADPDETEERFQFLYEEFRPVALSAPNLPQLREQFHAISECNTSEALISTNGDGTISFEKLEIQLAPFYFSDPTAAAKPLTEVALSFWPALKQAVEVRSKWANTALHLLVQGQAVSGQINEHSPDGPPVVKGLSLRQVALLHIYWGKPRIEKYNSNKVAAAYGYKSGEALYKKYYALENRLNEKEFSGKQLVHIIKDITEVKKLLTGEQRVKAEKHLLALGRL